MTPAQRYAAQLRRGIRRGTSTTRTELRPGTRGKRRRGITVTRPRGIAKRAKGQINKGYPPRPL